MLGHHFAVSIRPGNYSSLEAFVSAARPTTVPAQESNLSFVLEYPAADPVAANRHFLAKLGVETDPADVRLDMERASHKIIVIDARSAEAFAACHIPGAISLPHRSISASTTSQFSRDKVIVAYCWGPGCNASTKAAAKLSALGFAVKEMIGGIEYWRKEGYSVEGALGEKAPMHG